MHELHAHFSPSMTGILGRSRPKAVVAPGEATEEEGREEQKTKMDGGVAEGYSRRTNRRNRIYKRTYQRRGYLCQR
jgi:hypothetical protein